jgi:hypothetical protein
MFMNNFASSFKVGIRRHVLKSAALFCATLAITGVAQAQAVFKVLSILNQHWE